MKAFAKFIIILATCDICRSYYQPNVGSVLFTSNDLQKNRWTQSELALLRARRHFQNLIPHPKLSNSLSDEYLSHLLNYADNCYITIVNEAANPSEKDLMTNALSDVIGGYLKVWVLPITKYSYYGGTISPINAIKLFQMYEDIKRSLNTDGGTWKNPNEDLLQTVTINIASNPHEWYTRSTHKSCDSLSYYEKTDKGLTIPLPFISWDLYPQTMFIPLKDQSLIQLNSPNSSNALLDYYNVATSCIHSLNTDTIDDFGSRFQIWLSTDVVPHLKDDNLYVAFGSCLSLLNKTKNFYSHVVNLFDNTYSNLQCKAISACYPIPLTKKNILIAIIIFIEIVWCIPVLYYLLCTKKSSKKKRDVKNFFTYFRKDPKTLHGVKFFVKPRTRNLELDVEFPNYNHKFYNMKSTSTNISQNNVHYNVAQINESLKKYPSKPTETNNINKNVASHKINQTDIIETFNQNTLCNCKDVCDNKASCSLTNNQIMNNNSKTIGSYTGTPSSFMFLNENEIKNLSYTHATLSVSKSMCKSTIRSRSDTKVCSKKKPNTTVICPCNNCSKEKSIQVQCVKNIEKTSFKVQNPIVMQVINEHKRDERALCKAHIPGKINLFKTENIRKKAPAVTEVNLEKNNEKVPSNLVKLTANENNIKKLSIASNRITVNEKVTLGKGKTNNTSKVINNELKSFKDPYGRLSPATKDKTKSLKTTKPSEKVGRAHTSIKNDIDKKVSRINTFTIAEMPKAHKNIQNYMPNIDKKNKDHVSKMNESKGEEAQKEITKKSGIPKLNVLTPGTTDSIEPYKKRFNSPSKPCKIPRRIATHLYDQKEVSRKKEVISSKTLSPGRKSVKKTVDDTVIKKPMNKNTRLNTTL